MARELEKKACRVLVVGNYAPDRQESMLRFGRELTAELENAGVEVNRIAPPALLNRPPVGLSAGEARKLLGYVDKFILFPRRLSAAIVQFLEVGPGLVHILDHSNAVYGALCRRLPWLVTCHDLIAVRSARGEFGPQQLPRFTGAILQARIARSLARAPYIACDSDATRNDFLRLIGCPQHGLPRRIYLGINPVFTMEGDCYHLPANTVLHVGSGAWYKRRDRVLRIFARIRQGQPVVKLVLVGEPLDRDKRQLARRLGIEDAIFSLSRVTDEEMAALYRASGVLLFPSEVEGFGWPPLEAMACGCPVVCSKGGSLREVVKGPLSVVLDSADVEDDAFASAAMKFLRMDEEERKRLAIQQAKKSTMFSWKRCATEYLDFYYEILQAALR